MESKKIQNMKLKQKNTKYEIETKKYKTKKIQNMKQKNNSTCR